MDEREFELINILGGDIGSNQRDLSRHMNLSLGMINMLIRRLVSKGYIRIEQLNKRKVQYILTSKGFTEKMRKSFKYTLKTINSISFIKNAIKSILLAYYEQGIKNYYFFGNPDISILTEMVLQEVADGECRLTVLEKIPETAVDGVLLVCKEEFEADPLKNHRWVDLVTELAKDNPYQTEIRQSTLLQN